MDHGEPGGPTDSNGDSGRDSTVIIDPTKLQ
jgi:hypothetical protein